MSQVAHQGGAYLLTPPPLPFPSLTKKNKSQKCTGKTLKFTPAILDVVHTGTDFASSLPHKRGSVNRFPRDHGRNVLYSSFSMQWMKLHNATTQCCTCTLYSMY